MSGAIRPGSGPAVVRTVSGEELLGYGDGLRAVYADAFGGPPWNEGPDGADAYLERLADDVRRPGFSAAVALDGEGDVGDVGVVGWATAWTTPDPFPTGRSYPRVAAALGERATADWLTGALEVDELAVAGRGRGSGLGGRLLAAVTEDSPGGRCWLLTSAAADRTVAFYERAGWLIANRPVPEGTGLVVLLGPRHPAHAELASR
ncbi:GNAT family N-acetyltransferase [Streptomyces sp. NPDC090025]|uniref:GNAT family N-acetyltransferase n=1 Tax=Streptomyces sp. NPDC090025 TaxID=3365922 RepID=UPI003836A19E